MYDDSLSIFIVQAVGLGQLDDKERSRLFALLFSISSFMIYCSTASLQDSCLESIPEIASIRNWVEVYEDNKQLSDLYLETYAPFFCWTLLKNPGPLQDSTGNKVSSSQAFEQVLHSTTRLDPSAAGVREQLISTFRRRECLDLSAPDQVSADMGKVKELLKPLVLGKSKLKKVEGTTLEGSLFVSFCLGVVDSINSGFPAVYPTILSKSAAFDLKELATKAKLEYSNAMKTLFGGDAVYPKKDDMEFKLAQIRNQAFSGLNEAVYLAQADPELYLASLNELDKFIDQRETAARFRQQDLKKK